MAQDYRIVLFDRIGGPEVLRLGHVAIREPERGEVRIKVLAIGVTQGDAMFRSGTYLEQPTFPSGLGTEACGVIESVGEDAGDFKVGDRVSSISSFSIPRYPLYGEYAVLPVTALFHTPATFSHEEGAAWTLAYVPMYLALFRECRLKMGEWVFLNAAAATTSIAAMQMAKLAGARVIGAVRSREKAQLLQGTGYDHVLISSENIAAEVKTISEGGVHVAMDPVLGSGTKQLLAMMRHRGRVLFYGALSGPQIEASIYPMVLGALTLIGFTIYNYTGSVVNGLPRDALALEKAVEAITFGTAAGALKPLIAQRFPLDEVVKAHQASAAGKHVGKIILVP
jgi:NADPH:quinone reductase